MQEYQKLNNIKYANNCLIHERQKNISIKKIKFGQNYPLQSSTPPSSKYQTTLFKVPHHPLQSTYLHPSKYHTSLFKELYQKCTAILSINIRRNLGCSNTIRAARFRVQMRSNDDEGRTNNNRVRHSVINERLV